MFTTVSHLSPGGFVIDILSGFIQKDAELAAIITRQLVGNTGDVSILPLAYYLSQSKLIAVDDSSGAI